MQRDRSQQSSPLQGINNFLTTRCSPVGCKVAWGSGAAFIDSGLLARSFRTWSQSIQRDA